MGRNRCINLNFVTSEQRGHNNNKVSDDVVLVRDRVRSYRRSPYRKITITRADPWTGTIAAPESLPCGLRSEGFETFL